MGSIYGPLLIAGLAIVGASASIAGEEEDRILSLILAHPVTRSRLIVGKAAAIAAIVVIVAVASWGGLIAGVALAGGGISLGHLAAFSLQLAFSGWLPARSRSRSAPERAAARSPTEPQQHWRSSAG
jgi:ABC-2 type transport system permease protein